MSRVPVTVLTGFLGAGKTTLLRSLLTQADGRRIAVIVNEFGDAGFDGGLVEECAAKACAPGDIVELTNGCICCTVADDFVPTMDKLLSRERPLDAIVIETSGLALPQPLLKAFAWPAVKTRATVDGVVTVVDALALSEGRVTLDEDAVAEQRAKASNTTTQSRKCSRTSSLALIWWFCRRAISSLRKNSPRLRPSSKPCCVPA
jgi:cobalamin biosynthesis protein CobW